MSELSNSGIAENAISQQSEKSQWIGEFLKKTRIKISNAILVADFKYSIKIKSAGNLNFRGRLISPARAGLCNKRVLEQNSRLKSVRHFSADFKRSYLLCVPDFDRFHDDVAVFVCQKSGKCAEQNHHHAANFYERKSKRSRQHK